MSATTDTAPDATVVIVTKNRWEVLMDAIASAVAQEGDVEVLVVDDGSTDGTTDRVRERFPQIRCHRFDTSAGLVVRRNDAARLARGRVVVSLDDDAVLTTPHVVAGALRDLEAPGVAVVAIPMVDVLIDPREQQRAPSPRGVWQAAVFFGGAHAIDRAVFRRVGGYREAIFHQGEEHDLALRLLAAGYRVRLGTGDPIHHFASPRRSFERMDVYGRRNELLLCFTYHPFPLVLLTTVLYAAKGLVIGARVGRVPNMLRGIWEGIAVCWHLRGQRRPVPFRVLRLERRLRRAGGVRVA